MWLISLMAFALVQTSPVATEVPPSQKISERPVADSSEAAESADQKLICERYTVTGSRAKKRKVCMTAVEWRRQEEENRSTSRELLGGEGACTGGECRGE